MARPRRLRVGAIRHKVVIGSGVDMDGKQGLFDESRQTIHVAPGLGPDVERETSVHEAIHAAIAQTAFRNNLDSEEELAASLAPIIYAMIRDNKDWVAWLQE